MPMRSTLLAELVVMIDSRDDGQLIENVTTKLEKTCPRAR